ncbi:hypothetical protein CRSA5733_07520 [Cronobacter sakazakii]
MCTQPMKQLTRCDIFVSIILLSGNSVFCFCVFITLSVPNRLTHIA